MIMTWKKAPVYDPFAPFITIILLFLYTYPNHQAEVVPARRSPHPFFSSLYFLEESLTSPMTLQPWSVFDLNDLL